ncbi:hypothetical protein LJR232_000211 [Aquipseudomonas alcaligenes]
MKVLTEEEMMLVAGGASQYQYQYELDPIEIEDDPYDDPSPWEIGPTEEEAAGGYGGGNGGGSGGVSVGAEGSGSDVEVKAGADLTNLSEKITSILDEIVSVWKELNAPTPVITSGNDSTHGANSLHYANEAIDLRANNISADLAQGLVDQLRNAVGPDYDIIYETFPNSSNNHIHVEYDPK